MKDGLKDIIGKTISSVIVANNTREPQVQVFLVFEDQTTFEFWGEWFSCASGADTGGKEKALEYIRHMGARVISTYPAEPR